MSLIEYQQWVDTPYGKVLLMLYWVPGAAINDGHYEWRITAQQIAP